MGDAADHEELAVYTQILRIPPARCPPNHYELLGIARDERDSTNIDAAARERIEQLRRSDSPSLLRAARLVLKKIERARTCLLDSQARAAYDLAQTGEAGNDATESLWDELDLEAVETSSKSIGNLSRLLPISATGETERAIAKRPPSISKKKTPRQQKATAYAVLGCTLVLVSGIAALSLWPRSNDAGRPPDGADMEALAKVAELDPSVSHAEQKKLPNSTRIESDMTGSETSVSQEREPAGPSENLTALTNFQSHENVGSLEPKGELRQNAASVPDIGTDVPAPATAAPATNTLTDVLDAAELPPQRVTDSSLPSGLTNGNEGIELGPVPSQGLNLTIDQPAKMAVEGISFDITSDSSFVPGPAWEVRLRSESQQGEDDKKSALDDIAAGLDEVVARLYVEDGKLKFVWTNSRFSQLAEQLRNCVVCLSYSDQSHRIQLRLCEKIAPIVLDFEQSVVSIPVSGPTLPSPEATFLVVRPSPALLNTFTMSPESGTVPCNELLTLKLSGDAQQQIEIRVTMRSRADGFMIAFGPRYKIGSRWQPFTTERVNAGLEGLEEALVRHKDGLTQARDAARVFASELSATQSRLRSAREVRERHSLQVKARGLQTKLNRASRTVDRKQRDIPETEHDIALMKHLVQVGNRIRGYAEFGVKVGVKTVDGEINLLSTE